MAELVSISEAREHSELSHEQIANLARKGKIKARKSNKIWLVDVDSLQTYEERMKELGTAKHNPHPD